MEVLCLMGLFPEEYEFEINRDSIAGMQNAANKLQWAIVDGLAQQLSANIQIVNSMYIGSYPRKYKKAYIPSFAFKVKGEPCGYNVGFCNLPIVKFVSRYCNTKRKVDEWINRASDGEKVVIAYAMTSPMVELLQHIKLKYPQTKCILVVPDLPEYMDVTNKSRIYSAVKKLHISHLKKSIGLIDGFVLLTDYMKEWFNKDINYTVIEGIYKDSSILCECKDVKEKVVLYSGTLCKEYGIIELANAFVKIKEEGWTLELIGDGPLLPVLKQMAKSENCICVRGSLPNEEVLKRQKQVSILVNPRFADQLFTKYSFPSKTIEYMASGTPMIGYKLPGIPEEYFKYICEIKQEDEGLENCIKNVMMLSEQERNQFGYFAKKFIQEEKNAAKQCAKILELIKSIK